MVSKNRQIKIDKIKDIQTELKGLKTAVLIRYSKLNVQSLEKFRLNLSEINAKARIYKNTLLKLAFQNTVYQDLNNSLKGPLLIAFSAEESFELLKMVSKFQNEYESVTLESGFFEGQFLNHDKLVELAELPSAEDSLGKLIGLLQSPLLSLSLLLESKAKTMSA